MTIPQHFLDELINRSDLVEIIDAVVPLKKTGSNYQALCPFHNEKSPSFNVNPAKQFYHCFGCGASGNAVGFLMNYHNLDFLDAVEQLAGQLGLQIPQESGGFTSRQSFEHLHQLLERAASFYEGQLNTHLHAGKARYYLEERGLGADIIARFRIGFAPPGWDNLLKVSQKNGISAQDLENAGLMVCTDEGKTYDRFRDRIQFPIRDKRGHVVAFGGRIIDDGQPKYLNSPETAVFHKSETLYGLYEVMQLNKNPESLFVVEGYMDVAMLAQYGINNAVATLGTAITPQHLKQLLRLTSTVIFCFDGDTAGKKAAWRALKNVLPDIQDTAELKFLFLPDTDDPDSFVRREGKEALLTLAKNALPLSQFLLQSLSHSVNLKTTEGRAQLSKRAAPYIQALPETSAWRTFIIEQLGRLVRLDTDRLEKLVDANKTHTPQARATTLKSPRQRPSALRLAIALLLQHPELINGIPNPTPFAALEMPGCQVLLQLIDLLRKNPELKTGALLEYWRGKKAHDSLLGLLTWEHQVPEDGLQSEFAGILQRLSEFTREQRVDNLLAKANLEGLQSGEKQELQTLLSEKF